MLKQDNIPDYHLVNCCKNCQYCESRKDLFFDEWQTYYFCNKYDCSILTDCICNSYRDKD